jgi:anti-sigma regulatory factor (Ser/Thr protein kinase)
MTMETSFTPNRADFVHELLLHDSLEEMLAFVVPFVRDGAAAQEPTLLLLRPDTAATVLPEVRPSPYLTVLPALDWTGRPAMNLRAADTLLAGYRQGVPRVRMLSEEPIVPDAQWHEWRRREAAVSVALGHHQAWLVCCYDRRALDDERVADLGATHQLVGRSDEHHTSDQYQDPSDFLAKHFDAPSDPVEATTPAAELVNPSPSTARAAVVGFARHSGVPALDTENLVLAVSEAVGNALRHGRPPVVMRLWVQPDRITVTVTDTGPGPDDPFVGLLPPEHPRVSGLGLWLSHQLIDITHRRHPDGYTACLSTSYSPQRTE